MGIGGISIWQLLILLAIVVMVFGTKRLRNLGGDLGSAIKGFRSAMKEGDRDSDPDAHEREDDPRVIDQAGRAGSDAGPVDRADKRREKARRE